MSDPSAEVIEAIRRLANYVHDDEINDYRECASNENEQEGHIFESVLKVQEWLNADADAAAATIAAVEDEEDDTEWVVIDADGNYVKHAITGTWYDRDEAWAFAKEVDGQVREAGPDD